MRFRLIQLEDEQILSDRQLVLVVVAAFERQAWYAHEYMRLLHARQQPSPFLPPRADDPIEWMDILWAKAGGAEATAHIPDLPQIDPNDGARMFEYHFAFLLQLFPNLLQSLIPTARRDDLLKELEWCAQRVGALQEAFEDGFIRRVDREDWHGPNDDDIEATKQDVETIRSHADLVGAISTLRALLRATRPLLQFREPESDDDWGPT